MPNIICLFRGHDWRFSYNHGIPLGCTDEEWDKLIGKSYAVHQCMRCGASDLPPDTQAKILRAEGRQG